ncbi:hypothetical protein WN51_04381 [Melipona quadrifasciata]|uniref:Uncharacterized protein n=1 Tax=Melipona quadrifasciata TaxID=166423 RepID=A0A0M8ZTJ9_9HYME|nr:hypothetical protein WN51_04381 [Melipona quadrifasciata]
MMVQSSNQRTPLNRTPPKFHICSNDIAPGLGMTKENLKGDYTSLANEENRLFFLRIEKITRRGPAVTPELGECTCLSYVESPGSKDFSIPKSKSELRLPASYRRRNSAGPAVVSPPRSSAGALLEGGKVHRPFLSSLTLKKIGGCPFRCTALQSCRKRNETKRNETWGDEGEWGGEDMGETGAVDVADSGVGWRKMETP